MSKTHIIFVENMSCEKCVQRIEAELSNTRVDYTISLNSESVTVVGDNDAIRAAEMAINNAGYRIK